MKVLEAYVGLERQMNSLVLLQNETATKLDEIVHRVKVLEMESKSSIQNAAHRLGHLREPLREAIDGSF